MDIKKKIIIASLLSTTLLSGCDLFETEKSSIDKLCDEGCKIADQLAEVIKKANELERRKSQLTAAEKIEFEYKLYKRRPNLPEISEGILEY
ncbi:MAG: hypothetical protein EU981_02695 [Candidatus Liberibacter ctenarytainae]|uniref:Lipoprotein n=1 Tax=Candidatus Liberibacter ctenarytainae TaxID=2020335 RepID=A0A937AC20_9HYPH|nr:hypothetical protein [Candidatus Liberibacter ctenarytainae]